MTVKISYYDIKFDCNIFTISSNNEIEGSTFATFFNIANLFFIFLLLSLENVPYVYLSFEFERNFISMFTQFHYIMAEHKSKKSTRNMGRI